MQARGHEAAIFIVKRQYATPPWLNGLALSWRQNTLVYAWAAWFWTHFYITWAKPSIGVLNFNVRSSADGGRRVRQKKNVSVLTWQPLCSDHRKLSDGVKNVTIWSRSEGKGSAWERLAHHIHAANLLRTFTRDTKHFLSSDHMLHEAATALGQVAISQ
jgi:hypothetical protein